MSKQHRVALTDAERAELTTLLHRDGPTGLTLRRARILLHADVANGRPYQTDVQIGAATAVDPRTVARVRAQFATEGLAATLQRRPSARIPTYRLDAAAELRVVHLACTTPPDERDHWSLRMLANRVVELEIVDSISPETVRQTLKKTNSSPGKPSAGAFPRRPMPPLSRPWKTSSNSISSHPIPSAR
jgi:hypothetical protein